ncbi:MAG: glycosyltransferase [Anaerolineae bacterium]|nr:glycosyltransferase [Anaerolineae bacterium]
MLIALLRLLYLGCVALLTAYALGAGVILIAYLRRRPDPPNAAPPPPIDSDETDAALPTVCVQLPVFDEPFVVERLIDAAARLDYPASRLMIQVLDDSDDVTPQEAAARVAHWAARGVRIEHIRREKRQGFKAGALAHGAALCDAEFFVVFDADFVPPPDFLRRTLPLFLADPTIGMVQTRWGHLNADANTLTRAVALALDGHFVVEQAARSSAGWLLNFNGSGGVWRAKAIQEAGGWSPETLTEDLDLSYRAQLAGWRLVYLSDLVVPGEIPPRLSLYRQQQARWAQGGTQVLTRILGALWRSPALTLMQRLMATMHLAQYLVHVLVLILIILTPLLIALGALPSFSFGPLGLVSLFPVLIFAISQQALYPDWLRRLARGFPALLIIATGMAWSNARSALRGVIVDGGEFRRTPKFGSTAVTAIPTPVISVELILCLYSAFSAWLAFRRAPGLTIYFLIYTLSFGIMTIWLWRDNVLSRRRRSQV